MNNELTLSALVKRWWWALVAAAIVAGIVGYAIASKLPKSYQSTVTLLVGPVNTDTALDASGSLTNTYESLATSQPVLQAAINATHAHMTANQLQQNVTTTSNTVSRLVTISVSDGNKQRAANLANALATRISTLTNDTPSATNETITTFDAEPAVQALPSGTRLGIEQALRRVIGPAPAGQVTVINPAVPPTAAASPKKPLIALLAALGGVLITGLVLLLRTGGGRGAADERALAELEYAYLGAVDVSADRDGGGRISVEASPTSSTAANYRMLAARLSLVEGAGTARSLLVVDSTDGSAAAVVASNLAAALARTTGESILLADVADVAGATKLLGLQGEKGYSELLANPDLDALNGHLNDFFVDRGELLRVLPRGNASHAAPTSAERARALLRRLRESADLVVLSGPPVAHSPGGLIWARAAESVLFVVDGDKTSHDDVMQAANDLSLANANFLGTVIGRRRGAIPVLGRPAASRS